MAKESSEQWRDIAAVFRFDKDQLSRWMRQTAGQRRKYNVYLLIIGLLFVNFVIVLPTTANKLPSIVMAALCAALFAVVFLLSRSKRGANTVETLYHGGEEYRVFLYSDRMVARVGGQEQVFPYGEITRVQEHDDYFAFFCGGERRFLLPKAALSEAESAWLGHYWSERLQKGYKLCDR